MSFESVPRRRRLRGILSEAPNVDSLVEQAPERSIAPPVLVGRPSGIAAEHRGLVGRPSRTAHQARGLVGRPSRVRWQRRALVGKPWSLEPRRPRLVGSQSGHCRQYEDGSWPQFAL